MAKSQRNKVLENDDRNEAAQVLRASLRKHGRKVSGQIMLMNTHFGDLTDVDVEEPEGFTTDARTLLARN